MKTKPLLVVITGPTAVGKTTLAIKVAQHFGTEIISADSRQFFREMSIGTAVPTSTELKAAPHHFIGHLSVNDAYDVSRYEADAINLLEKLFQKHPVIIMTGGSGLYINAVCEGFDAMPDPDPVIRNELQRKLDAEGIEALQLQLKQLDPPMFGIIDKMNPSRLLRAIEVCLLTGKPCSSLRRGEKKERPFRFLKIALNRERSELFRRISIRTDEMIAHGLVEEVRNLRDYKHLNALKTVGYQEIFSFLDGMITLEQAVTDIKTNTRRYAKRQLTWFKKDQAFHWYHPDDFDEIVNLIEKQL